MKNLLKKNVINIIVACAIAIPLSIYGVNSRPTECIAASTDTYTPTVAKTTDTAVVTQTIPEASIMVNESPITATPVGEPSYFNVPLSNDLQDFIFRECEQYNIAPAIIISMIEQESGYHSSTISDNGDSLGLMQIQPKWHQKLMDELYCPDLLNPYDNIKVGIRIIADLSKENNDICWVLMAYNGGKAYATKNINNGIVSDYAKEVTERAFRLENP